jgi:hypothetical protein
MAEIPEHLLRRSAEAKAKATGRDVDEVLAEMKGEAPPPAPEPAPPAEPDAEAPATAEPPAEVPGVPAHLLARSQAARQKAEGETAPDAAAGAPEPAETPAEVPGVPAHLLARSQAARQKAEGETAPDAEPPATAEPPAEVPGVPAHLLARSQAARAKAEGTAAPAAAPAATSTATAAAPKTAPAPTTPGVPEGVRTQRLLTVVKAGAIQQVRSEPADKVNVWPHLLAIEFVALLAVSAILIIFSVFVDAPLLELANFNDQPNPSKAPWYFLGLQELLSYFDPQVAGVLVPGLGLAGLAAIPYIDRNPSIRPSDRKLAIMIFTFFMMAAALLTIYGSFFRGPGFNFTFPWQDGLFFDF